MTVEILYLAILAMTESFTNKLERTSEYNQITVDRKKRFQKDSRISLIRLFRRLYERARRTEIETVVARGEIRARING